MFFALLLTLRACVGDPSALSEKFNHRIAVWTWPFTFPVDSNPTASFTHVSEPLFEKLENPVKKRLLFGCG